MATLFEKKQPHSIQGKDEISFSSFSSFHLITITARAKGEKQISRTATDDEDLIIKIDGKTFPKLNSERRIDSPAAFSGGGLHNHAKTIYYLTFLKGKDHSVVLESDRPEHSPVAEYISISTLTLDTVVTFDVNQQAEDGDTRPWITFVLDDLPLASIDLALTYSRRKWDSDDVKILIDGKNQSDFTRTLKHFLWTFVGSLLPWSASTKTQTKTFSPNLLQGLHYIELHADRMPILNSATFYFGASLPLPEDIPTIDHPKWTGDFYDDTEAMLLARAIWGEARSTSQRTRTAVAWSIKNRLGGRKEWDAYHHIILQPAQYSAFWETSPNDPNLKALRDPLGSTQNPRDRERWRETHRIAVNVIQGDVPDLTNGANHYYDDSISPPEWAHGSKPTLVIEGLYFFRLR